MSKKLPTNYSLFDEGYGNDYPYEQYFIHLFDELPSRHSDQQLYNNTVKDFFLKSGYILDCMISHQNRRNEPNDVILYVNKEKRSFVRIFSSYEKNIEKYKIEVYYDIKKFNINQVFNWEELEAHKSPKNKSDINLVKSEMGHMDTEEYDLFAPEIDLELNYGKSFLNIHDTIIKRLNTPNDKGIILLHGEPGTGKTSYLKYLAKLIENKEILFIPPSMAEMLSEPTIIPFLLSHKNSILIIEDAERVISDRETNGSVSGVSNILNITDGILGDCLGIQIIATFNMKREKIDHALLRKGRLIAEHKFDKLNVEETNILLKHLGKDHVVNEGMTLADIYNIDVEVFKTQNKQSKIGFNK